MSAKILSDPSVSQRTIVLLPYKEFDQLTQHVWSKPNGAEGSTYSIMSRTFQADRKTWNTAAITNKYHQMESDWDLFLNQSYICES